MLLICCAAWMLRFAWIEQNIFSGKRIDKYVEQSHNSPLLTYTAQNDYLFEANLPAAEKRLVQALKSNSFYIPAWLTLASVVNDQGEKKQADAILNYSDKLTTELLKWRWDKVLVAYELGHKEMLPGELRFIINKIPGKERNSALKLADRLFPTAQKLQENLGEENLLHLFHHALHQKNTPFALHFLQELEKRQEELSRRDKLWLINTLISRSEFETGRFYWKKWFENKNIVYNGNFAKPFLGTAFGWRIGKNKDFVHQIISRSPQETKGKELQFRFKGWKNLSFAHFYQIIPVQQGARYQFSAMMKSQKLTTDQRPFFQIYGYGSGCSMRTRNFGMVAPTQSWKKETQLFDVPCGCSAVVLRLRREESRQIDNKMSGKLWVKDVNITDSCIDCGSTFRCKDKNGP